MYISPKMLLQWCLNPYSTGNEVVGWNIWSYETLF